MSQPNPLGFFPILLAVAQPKAIGSTYRECTIVGFDGTRVPETPVYVIRECTFDEWRQHVHTMAEALGTPRRHRPTDAHLQALCRDYPYFYEVSTD